MNSVVPMARLRMESAQLWPNKRVIKCKYYVSQKQNGFNNKMNLLSILLTFVFEYTAKVPLSKIYKMRNLTN